MNTLPDTSLATRSAGLGAAGWPSVGAAQSAAGSDAAAGTQAAAWFNESLVEGSRLLRAPVQPALGDGQALCERFLACLQGPEAA